jgi:uncharacterized membrane protein YgcG
MAGEDDEAGGKLPGLNPASFDVTSKRHGNPFQKAGQADAGKPADPPPDGRGGTKGADRAAPFKAIRSGGADLKDAFASFRKDTLDRVNAAALNARMARKPDAPKVRGQAAAPSEQGEDTRRPRFARGLFVFAVGAVLIYLNARGNVPGAFAPGGTPDRFLFQQLGANLVAAIAGIILGLVPVLLTTRLREAQAGERDVLAVQHEQDRMREVDALIARMKARHSEAEARDALMGGSSSSVAVPPVPSAPAVDSSVPGFDPAQQKAMDEEVDRIIARTLEELGRGDKETGKDGGESGDGGKGKGGSSSGGGGKMPRAKVLREDEEPTPFTRKPSVGKAPSAPAPVVEPGPDQSVPGFDAESLKRMDAATDKLIAKMKDDLQRGDEKAQPSSLPVAKIDPSAVRDVPPTVDAGDILGATSPAPVSRKRAKPEDDRIREREHPSDRSPPEGFRPEDVRTPLTQEEYEKLARREKAIRMKKAREARQARARDRDRDGPDR